MNKPTDRAQGLSRLAHLHKVIARDGADAPPALHSELETLTAHMDARYPGWDAPPPPPAFPPTLRACKRLALRIRAEMTADGTSKRSRAELRTQLDQLEAHIQATFPEPPAP